MGESIQLEDRKKAKKYFDQCLDSYRRLDDLWGQAKGLTAMGWLAAHEGDSAGVKQLGEESKSLRQRIGDQRGMADSLWLLGSNIVFEDVDEAKRLINESLKIRQDMGDRIVDVTSGPVDLGMTLTWIGRNEEAEKVREETLASCIEQGLTEKIAEAYIHLSTSNAHTGKIGEMKKLAQEGYEIYKQDNNRRGMARAQWRIASADWLDGNGEDFIPILQDSVSTLREFGDDGEICWILCLLAEANRLIEKTKQAKSLLVDALRIGSGILAVLSAIMGTAGYALILAGEGEAERSVELLGLTNQHPFFSESKAMWMIYGKELETISSQLSNEVVVKALDKGRSLDIKDTAKEILLELESKPA
jgi:tetratricopeptide (TPR) repeat protein